MLLVELPPAYLSSPCGKTATRFFGQRETPPKFKAILEERGGRGRLFLFSRAPADGGRNENDRQTDIRPACCPPSADLQLPDYFFHTCAQHPREGCCSEMRESNNFTILRYSIFLILRWMDSKLFFASCYSKLFFVLRILFFSIVKKLDFSELDWIFGLDGILL